MHRLIKIFQETTALKSWLDSIDLFKRLGDLVDVCTSTKDCSQMSANAEGKQHWRGHLTSDNSSCLRIQSDCSSKFCSIIICCSLHYLIAVAPIADGVAARIVNVEEWTEDWLHESTNEDMHALNLLCLQVGLDMNRRVLGEQLAKLQLGVVQCPITGNIAGNTTLLAGIDQGFLAVNHQLVIAEIAAYNHVTGGDKIANSIMVKCVALDESHLRGGGDSI